MSFGELKKLVNDTEDFVDLCLTAMAVHNAMVIRCRDGDFGSGPVAAKTVRAPRPNAR